MTTQTPAVDKPDSATHFLCPSLCAHLSGDNLTHHLVPRAAGLTCVYCKKTDAEIRQAAGL